jgi:hypothetical protein
LGVLSEVVIGLESEKESKRERKKKEKQSILQIKLNELS